MSNEQFSVSRRAFLGLGAAAAGMAALAGCTPQAPAEPGALSETGGDDWLGAEPEIAEDEIVETIDTEVLVCGAGTSGLFAACAAAENGAKVVCLEKGSIGGGVRDNLGSLNSRLQKEAGCEIDENEICNDLTRYANGYVNPRLYHIWAQNSGEAVDWYEDRLNEAGFELFFEAADKAKPSRYKHWATGHIPSWPADAEFAGLSDVVNGKIVLGDYATAHGVDFRFLTPMVRLLHEDGKVTGAIAKGENGYIKVNASKGTVVCTGGYARNDEMLAALQPQTLKKYSLSIAIDGTTGDGIKACLWAGAHMDEMHTAMVFDRIAVKPDEYGGSDTVGSLFWMGSNPWLKVNLNGERFINESAPYDYVLNAALTQPHHTIVDIWDSDYEQYLENFDIHGCARVVPFDNGAPTNMTLDVVKGMNEGLLAEGYIVQADTIEELAEGLGIPAENLKKTVERQNENFDNQVDPDFGKEDFRLSAIRTPPFFGVRTSGYMLCTLDGITINEQFQAVNDDGEAIEGLYVAGVDSGSYYAGTYPNMSTGNCCGRSVTFARMIGKALAAK
ncbi:FAD-dependent oxidoreductase [uncultured Adlercreutzia sp.]|uniref:FAD-dependent oxidoreductase n=1 Tax=uncultured Adlercreutzia sp. TaxID=875803 RepID=UPI0025E0DDA9|nr:FAD-dependent oxidoreductase [uncultured Adlercreutzia sp.]MCI9262546.1 FAD-dependent oxidoreductase [Eggerthellaceae bacterium]